MMNMKFFLVLFLFCTISVFAQKSLNDYKYVIVPVQYDFQKSEDSYQINSLTKFLFNKAGFVTLLSTDNFPEDLSRDRCLALTAKVNNNSKMLSTKMNIDLVDCNNKVFLSTTEAKTKEKAYQKAYQEVIRESFEDIVALDYKYSGDENGKTEISTEKQEETATISNTTPVVVTPAVVKEEDSVKPAEDTVVEEKATINSAAPVEEKKAVTPAVVSTATVVAASKVVEVETDKDVLYAQAIENGYQLVDSTPKVVYIVWKTTLVDVYVIKGKDGIIYKSNGSWVAEYYVDGKLVRKELDIKLL